MYSSIEIIGLIGATIIFTSGYVFNWLHLIAAKISKTLSTFLACAMCMGFWTGFIYSAIFHNDLSVLSWVLCGCTVSIGANVLDAVITRLER